MTMIKTIGVAPIQKCFRNLALIPAIIIFFCCASEGQNSSGLKTTLSALGHLGSEEGSATSSHPDEKAARLAHPEPDPTAVKVDDSVITIHGLCTLDNGMDENDSKSCVTTVTRQQFDALLDAANVSGQQVSTLARQKFAKGYVLYLAFEQAARKAGFEDTEQ